MEPRPIYKIRKNGKQEVFEGTLDEVRKWLRQNNISSTQEMRRQGFSVLELDEFWGLVSDFPEFSMTERQGRGYMLGKIKAARLSVVFGLIVLAAGLALFAANHLYPRYQHGSEVRDLTQQVVEKESQHQSVLQELKKLSDSLNAENSRLSEQIVSLQEQLKKVDDDKEMTKKQIAGLEAQVEERKTTISRNDALIAQLNDANMKLTDKLNELNSKAQILPVIPAWEGRYIGESKILTLWNTSNEEMKLKVRVDSGNGKEVTNVISVPGKKAFKSGAGTPFSDHFKPGEIVEITYERNPSRFATLRITVPSESDLK